MRKMEFIQHPQTDADVKRLLDSVPDLVADGRLITHESVERILVMHREQARYKTVVRHWRRAVFQERHVFLDGRSAEGHGWKALTPDEMIRFANREVRGLGRRLKRALILAATPQDDEITDPNSRLYRARLLSATEQIAQAHGRVVRDLSQALKPPRQLRSVN